MVNNGLVGKLKNRFYTGLVAGSMALGLGSFYGCDNGVEPVVRSVSQSIQLVRDNDIEYTASFKHVDGGTRKTLHNGSPMDMDSISGPNYSETLKDNLKGNYMFVLDAEGAEPDTTETDVPNYFPEEVPGAFSSLVMDFSQGSQTTINLEGKFFDRNTEDNPVLIAGYRVLSGDISVSLNGYDLNIVSNGNPGAYEVEVIPGSEEGGFGRKVLSGEVLEVKDQIAFAGSDNIYLINEDGSGLEKLTNGPQDLGPAFSPDGKRLAFNTNRNGNSEIYIREMSNGSLFRLTEGIGASSQPAFSPDGTKIAFRYREGDLAGIGLIDLDGTGFTRIIEGPAGGRIPGGPSWSPDGTRIAFHKFIDGNWEIYTMDVDGTHQTNITNSPAYDISPAWSPDGSRISFVSDPNPNDGFYELEIYVVNPDGSDKIQLTNNSAKDLDPSWTPDGIRIVFARRESPATTQDIWIMDKDGTNEIKIFESPLSHERDPVFRPKQ